MKGRMERWMDGWMDGVRQRLKPVRGDIDDSKPLGREALGCVYWVDALMTATGEPVPQQLQPGRLGGANHRTLFAPLCSQVLGTTLLPPSLPWVVLTGSLANQRK